MNKNFNLKGNKGDSKTVLKSECDFISKAFEPYNDLRFDYFRPTHDIRRKLKQQFLQERRETNKEFYDFYDNSCSKFYFESDRTIFDNNEIPLKLQPSELYKKIVTKNVDQVVGQIYYLIGEIGCGKSTYISALIREFDKSNLNVKQGLLFHVIKFSDIKEFYVKNISTDEITDEILIRLTDEILIKLLLKFLNSYLRSDYQIPHQLTIEGFINYCIGDFSNHKLIFVFDDMDEIYDEHATNLFSYDGVEKEYSEWLAKRKNITLAYCVRKLIEFMRGFRGKNIDFIVSLRPNSYQIATHTGRGVGNASNPCIIYLTTNRESILGQDGVITKRIERLQKNVPDINIDIVRKNLASFVDVGMVHKLHGLRHIIDNTAAMLAKNLKNVSKNWMFEVFTYLDNQDAYTQNRGGIVNIFLVNSKYRKHVDKVGDAGYPKYPDYMKSTHSHTYWLKYLIACHFQKTDQSDSIMYEKNFTEYERHIYQLCIYSLTEVQHGRLISCVPNPNKEGGYLLKSTDRLKHCVGEKGENLFFKFTYLAVIVDDAYLEIPSVLDGDDDLISRFACI